MGYEVSAAESFVVADAGTGQVILSRDRDEVRQVASLTKVATTMVALHWLNESEGDISQLIPVRDSALAGGINPLGLQSGDRISIESALYASMMASDNTSATVLAEFVGSQISEGTVGPAAVDAFVQQMNELAKALEMERTMFVNPHGLDGDGALGESTAADLARLTIAAYREPLFVRFCSAREKEITHVHAGEAVRTLLLNTNELVGSRRVDGVKTGTTRRAGACLITSATENEAQSASRLIVVVLAAKDRFEESVVLLNQGWEARGEWIRAGKPVDTNTSLLIDAK